MTDIKVIIIYPADPLGPNVGGIQTFIKGFIKYAPPHFNIDFIGITTDCEKRKPKEWVKLNIGGREFNFFPLFFERNINRKTIIPLTLRFTVSLKLANLNIEKGVLFFHRLEPAMLYDNNKLLKVIVVHNDIKKQILGKGSEVFWSKFSKLYLRFENSIFPFLDKIYTVNMNTLDFYRERYSQYREKFFFIPTWVDVDQFRTDKSDNKSILREEIVEKYGAIKTDFRWILFVGRLQEQKKPLRLIDVFAEFRSNNKSSCLIIAGEGNLRKVTEKYVRKLGIEKYVTFLGGVDQKDLVNIYRASDAMLLTSDFEGMPMSVLEALGCGLPVVTTDVGEVRRVVRNNISGEVVESFETGVIAQSLSKVIDNSKNYTVGNCVDSIGEYIPQKILKQLYKVMEEIYI